MAKETVQSNPMVIIESVIHGHFPRLLIDDNGALPNPLPTAVPEKLLEMLKKVSANAIAAWAGAVCHIRARLLSTPAHSEEFATLVDLPVGTGFLVAPHLVLTNKHVGEYLCTGRKIDKDKAPHLTFAAAGDSNGGRIPIVSVRAWGEATSSTIGDWALLEIEQGQTNGRIPLTIDNSPKSGKQGVVAVVGYPVGYDKNEGIDHPQYKVFPEPGVGYTGVQPRKSLSPGFCVAVKNDGLMGLIHDSSVLPGSSGSPVISLASGKVIGLHYSGLRGNLDEDYNAAVSGAELGEVIALSNQTANTVFPTAALTKVASEFTSLMFGPSFGMTKDSEDFRDFIYNPSLVRLPDSFPDTVNLPAEILNQGSTSACTAFALVHALGVMDPNNRSKPGFSTRMAYEMARLHDEFPEQSTQGSTLRGVVKGFYHNGLAPCQKREWTGPWRLSYKLSKEARSASPGAYYRLRPVVSDFQSALHEASAIIVSAHVHEGWIKPAKTEGKIPFARGNAGLAHAFVIVGYDQDGFIVLNSAGDDWSKWNGYPGCAHWSYVDWAENVIDGWVLRMAVPAPSVFGKAIRRAALSSAETPLPRRSEVLGHVILSDEGKLASFGRAAMDEQSVEETAALFQKPKDARQKYRHLLFVAHSEVTSEDEILKWCASTKPFFKDNGIYPISLACDPAFATAFRELLGAAQREAEEQAGPAKQSLDQLFEHKLRRFGSKLWAVRQKALQNACRPGKGFFKAIKLLHDAAHKSEMGVHVVTHHGGSQLVSAMLRPSPEKVPELAFDSLHMINAILDHQEFDDLAKRLPIGKEDRSRHVTAKKQRLVIYGSARSANIPDQRWLAAVERGFGQPIAQGISRSVGLGYPPSGWASYNIAQSAQGATAIWQPAFLQQMVASILHPSEPVTAPHEANPPKSWLAG